MRYDLDLTKIALDTYLVFLKQQTLLPSRQILHNDIDCRFARIRAQGVENAAQLFKALSTPAKIEAFAKQSGVPADYLTILRREAGTLKRKPVKLSAFPDTDAAQIGALAEQGIKTAKAYYESGKAGGRLYALCDLTRINGIGPCAAAMFYAAGVCSVNDIANAAANTLLARVTAANENHRYYAGTLGAKDMLFCIDYAKLLERFLL